MSAYYIDPSASANGIGTAANPFNTWASVPVGAGNAYFQRRGTSWTGTFPTLVGGTATNNLTIVSSYSGDGWDDPTQPLPILNIGNSGISLPPFTKFANSDVRANQLTIAASQAAVFLQGSNIEVSNCRVTTNAAGIGGNELSNTTIANNVITAATASASVMMQGVFIINTTSQSNNAITGNVVYLGTAGTSVRGIYCATNGTNVFMSNLLVKSNTVTLMSGAAPLASNSTSHVGVSVSYAILPEVSYNTVTSMVWGVNVTSGCSNPYVHHNTCNYNGNTFAGSGISIYGSTSGSLVEWNTCRHNAQVGISIDQLNDANITRFNDCSFTTRDGNGIFTGVAGGIVYGNTLYKNGGAGIAAGGSYDAPLGGRIITGNYLIQNTADQYGSSQIKLSYLSGVRSVVSNNLIVGGKGGVSEFQCSNVEKSNNIFLSQSQFAISAVPQYVRNSIGSYYDFQGVLRTVDVSVQRASSIPDSWTSTKNLLQWSEDFGNAVWVKTSAGTGTNPIVVSRAFSAPDGSLSASRVMFNKGSGSTTSDYSLMYQQVAVTNAAYTVSVWLKSNTSANQTVVIYANGAGKTVVVTPVWQQFSVTDVTTSMPLAIGTRGGSGQFYTGGDQQLDILVWGAQLEAGSSATTYVPSREMYPVYEQATTNFLPYSDSFSLWYSNGDSGTIFNYGIAPNGERRSCLISSGTRYMLSDPLDQNAVYTYSVYVKKGTGTDVFAYLDGSVAASAIKFTFATATLSGLSNGISGTSQALGNGWWRISLTFVNVVSAHRAAHLYPVGGSVEFWGAQVELTPVVSYGVQAVYNGNFSVDTSGWTAGALSGGAPSTLSVVNGKLRITNTGETYGSATSQAIAVTPGVRYSFSLDFILGNGGYCAAYVGSTPGTHDLGNYDSTGNGLHLNATFVPSTGYVYITLFNYAAPNSYGDYDNVSIRPVTFSNAPSSYVSSAVKFMSRASQKSYYNKNGLLAYAGSDQAAYDYDQNALRYENLLPWSENFSSVYWSTQASGTASLPVLTPNFEAAPDGSLTATRVVFSTGTGTTSNDQSLVYTSGIGGVISGFSYTGSFWVKGVAGTALLFRSVGINAYTVVTLTGVWQRVSAVEVGSAGNFEFGLRQGVQGTVNNSATVSVWGAQLNSGTTALEYSKTTGVAQPKQYTERGLSLEVAGTNLWPHTSSSSTNLSSTGATVVDNVAIAPDGTRRACGLHIPNSAAYVYASVATTAGQTYTGSLYVRQNGNPSAVLYIRLTGNAGNPISGGTIKLEGPGVSSDVAGTGWNVTGLSSTWTRISITNTSATEVWRYLLLSTDASGPLDIFAFGFQIEASSAVTSYMPAVETFTARSSQASYVDLNGVIQMAAIGEARYTYEPSNLSVQPYLLLEPAATNYITNSTLSSGWLGSPSITSSGATYRGIPYKVVAKTTTLTSEGCNTPAQAVASGAYVTLSIALRANSTSSVSVGIYDTTGGTNWGVAADSTCVTLEGPGTVVQDAGSLFDITGLSTTVDTVISITRRFATAGTAGAYIYPGTPGSATVGDSIQATRVQLEDGRVSTSYIPSFGFSASRSPDVYTSGTGSRASDALSGTVATRAADVCSVRNNIYSTDIPIRTGDTTTTGVAYSYGSAGNIIQLPAPLPIGVVPWNGDVAANPLLDPATYAPLPGSPLLDSSWRDNIRMFSVPVAVSDA